MLSSKQRIEAFVRLGAFMEQFAEGREKKDHNLNSLFYDDFEQLVKTVHIRNAWFTETNVRKSIAALALVLLEQNIDQWLGKYGHKTSIIPKKIGVIMAGNIPLVGFHDFLSVILSGNYFLG